MNTTKTGKIDIDSLYKIKSSKIKRLFSFKDKLLEYKKEGKTAIAQGSLSADGVSFNISYTGEEYITFKIISHTKEREQRITIESGESNLVDGSKVYYFICPYTLRRCRVLYSDGVRLFSRFAIAKGYIYSKQRRSRFERKFALLYDEPYQRCRKTYYRGKITAYGRKMQRYEAKYEEVLNDATFTTPLKRGRPKKSI